MIRQRIYQIGAGYEDCNDADFLRIDPALRLALGKDHQAGAGQSMLCRLENDILGNEAGLLALEAALTRSTNTLLTQKRRVKFRYPDIKRLSSIYLSPAPWNVEIVSGSGP
jgi:hypothetical protein